MHRSGTSMITRALHDAGLALVGTSADELKDAADDNPEGFWENKGLVEVNDSLLEASGGAWDHPPEPVPQGVDDPRVAHIADAATAALAPLRQHERWGFKDPRTCLTAAYWLDLEPELRFVLCIRHPIEVAQSLKRRNQSSYSLGLALWERYYATLLELVPSERIIVTHYDTFFTDPVGEVERLCEFVGLEPTPPRVLDELRHHSTGIDLVDAGASASLRSLYAELCRAAGVTPPREAPADEGRVRRLILDGAVSARGTPSSGRRRSSCSRSARRSSEQRMPPARRSCASSCRRARRGGTTTGRSSRPSTGPSWRSSSGSWPTPAPRQPSRWRRCTRPSPRRSSRSTPERQGPSSWSRWPSASSNQVRCAERRAAGRAACDGAGAAMWRNRPAARRGSAGRGSRRPPDLPPGASPIPSSTSSSGHGCCCAGSSRSRPRPAKAVATKAGRTARFQVRRLPAPAQRGLRTTEARARRVVDDPTGAARSALPRLPGPVRVRVERGARSVRDTLRSAALSRPDPEVPRVAPPPKGPAPRLWRDDYTHLVAAAWPGEEPWLVAVPGSPAEMAAARRPRGTPFPDS